MAKRTANAEAAAKQERKKLAALIGSCSRSRLDKHRSRSPVKLHRVQIETLTTDTTSSIDAFAAACVAE